jgi:phosphoribosylcarboxyaminoimidazole (NCAIR) mutase
MGKAAGVTVVVVTGSQSDRKNDDNALVVTKLFGLPVTQFVIQAHDSFHTLLDAERSTTVYVHQNPPVLWNENTAVAIAVPN